MKDSYRTIKKRSEGIYKEKGSKFIGIAYPVRSEEEIKERLQELRKSYYDARHHCYAWALGAEREKFRANDDGEPSNSAGKPILGRLEANDISQVLIVVVRYFGGTKLGVGGLINAYRSAAQDAIDNAEILSLHFKQFYEVKFDYLQMNDVMKRIKNLELEQIEHQFENDCRIKLASKLGDYESHKKVLLDIDNIHIKELEIA